MPLFIKTESFTKETINMLHAERSEYITSHKVWVETLINNGRNIFSGYLTNEEGKPGGGGLLILEASNFEEAKLLIMKDPMIKNNLVDWNINELVAVSGDLTHMVSVEKFP